MTIGVVLNSPLIARTATLLLSGGAFGSMILVGFAPASAATAPATATTATPDPVMTTLVKPATLTKSTTTAKPTATAKPATTAKPAAASTATSRQQRHAATAVRYAKAQIGDRYSYGGDGPNAWDCSGLVKAAWKKAGVTLPRVTTAQYRAVDKKVSWSHLRSGDLVFFYDKGHVGIYVGKGYMVHAPTSGRRVQKVKLGSYYRGEFSGAVRPGA